MAKSGEAKSELFTSGKLAEKFGTTPAKIKKAIQELELAPDSTKGVCNYYTEASAMKIKAKLG
jgi:hypothetical protein